MADKKEIRFTIDKQKALKIAKKAATSKFAMMKDNGFTFKVGSPMMTATVEVMDGVIYVSGIGPGIPVANTVYNEIQSAIEEAQEQPSNGSGANTNTVSIDDQKKIVALLKEYKELLDMGVITQEEFDAKKKELLGGSVTTSTPTPEITSAPAPVVEEEKEEEKPTVIESNVVEELNEEETIYTPIDQIEVKEKERFEELNTSFETEEVVVTQSSGDDQEEELAPLPTEEVKPHQQPTIKKEKVYVHNQKCRRIEIIAALASPFLFLIFFILISALGNPPYFQTFSSLYGYFSGILITVFIVIHIIGDAGYITLVMLNRKERTKVIKMLFGFLTVLSGLAFVIVTLADETFKAWYTFIFAFLIFAVCTFNLVITFANKRDSLEGTDARRPFWIIPVTIGSLVIVCTPIVGYTSPALESKNHYLYAMSILESNPEEAAEHFWSCYYKDANQQHYFALARACFFYECNDYEQYKYSYYGYSEGIHYMVDNGGKVNLNLYVEDHLERTFSFSDTNRDDYDYFIKYIPTYGSNTFFNWELTNYVFSDSNYTVTLDLKATWEEDEFTISFDVNNFSLGYIVWYSKNPNYYDDYTNRDIKEYESTKYRRVSYFYLSATSYEGSKFDHWEIDGKLHSYSQSFDYTVKKNATIKAIFRSA